MNELVEKFDRRIAIINKKQKSYSWKYSQYKSWKIHFTEEYKRISRVSKPNSYAEVRISDLEVMTLEITQ